MSLIKSYQKLLKNHFLVVNAIQTGALMATGDVVAQTFIEKKNFQNYQPKRTGKFFLLGTVLVGPNLTFWYRFLARRFGTEMTPKNTLKKVLCDQLIFAPSFLAVFLSSVNILNGNSLKQIKKEFSGHNYRDIVVANWKLWPAVQFLNFYIVPLNYQVIVVNGVALIWNIYLSWKTNQ